MERVTKGAQAPFKLKYMCLYPRVIKNRKYTSTKKNGGNIPELKDRRAEFVPVGCGKCIECMKQKARTWFVRLQEEIKTDNTGIFVTLTFSDEAIKKLSEDIKAEGYILDNEIATKATRLFLERWRKKYKKSIKHWLVTELGHKGTENLHIHGILFTNKGHDIENIWQYGFVFKGDYVNNRTISYITKYVTKTDKDHPNYTQKILTSAGIGKNYLNTLNAQQNKYKGKNTVETYKNAQGYKMNLPIYYRNHIYTDEEKEILWINKLDKQKRYICGEEIDISKGDDDYYKLLKYYQERNKQLGYGDNEKNWEKIKYENQRRNIMISQRLKKT